MGANNIVLTRKDFTYFSGKTLSNIHGSDIFSKISLVSEDGQFIDAHKIILSYNSTVLNKLVLIPKKVLVMEESYAELFLSVKFMYTGKCEVEQKNLK